MSTFPHYVFIFLIKIMFASCLSIYFYIKNLVLNSTHFNFLPFSSAHVSSIRFHMRRKKGKKLNFAEFSEFFRPNTKIS